jgi:hypothetical protein
VNFQLTLYIAALASRNGGVISSPFLQPQESKLLPVKRAFEEAARSGFVVTERQWPARRFL